jgi:single-stranded-DNA-specific exonuclease
MDASTQSSGMHRNWIDPQPTAVDPEFQAQIGGHPLVAQILVRRGIRDTAAARAFLNPQSYSPTPPEVFPGMAAACERIEQAITRREHICVWGDFDVDGQTSTTLLVSALRGLGAEISFHIPVRATESHGVNIENLKPVLDGGVSLVITCDVGISANEALAYAHSRGVDVIVTDHHALPETLPEALALINPHFLPEDSPLSGLPGVGVAYKLVEALYRRAGRTEETQAFLDLVAMGIVSDLALQTQDTRYLLQKGLPVLRSTQRTGLQVLYELSSLQPACLSEEHIGFIIGPRMNALGRLDNANSIVEFLTTTDAGRARVLATHLEGLNAQRRLLTGQVLSAALAQIQKDPTLLEQSALVLSHPQWPAGVIGIVASELAERYNRPTILLSAPDGQPARGSARSVEGVNIIEAIAAQKSLLLGYGGHPMAAGLSLDSSKIPAFRHALSRFIEKACGGVLPRPTLEIDGILSLNELSLALVEDLERLAPFGPGNPPLVLVIPRVSIVSSSTIGRDGNHLQLVIKDEHDQTQRVLWWGGADWPLPEGIFDLACTIRASNFRGQRDVQVEWVDARPVDAQDADGRRVITVIDQRGLPHPLPTLSNLVAAMEKAPVIWAEVDAVEKLRVSADLVQNRLNLHPADTLVIWSTPPGRAELKAALEQVNPHTVILFGIDPQEQGMEAFLKRLAGLVKFALQNRGGKTSLQQLAAATGQREATVRFGLRWMQQRGMVKVEWLPEGQVDLKSGAQADLPSVEGTTNQIKALIQETSAFRNFFQTADKDYLL